MKTFYYNSNSELWAAEDRAESQGFRKTADCYWSQIFTNSATGEQIATVREDEKESTISNAFIPAEAQEVKTAKAESKPAKVRKISGHDDWVEIWEKCGENMIETMIRNMKADLEAGYNSMGDCIRRQREAIAEYQNNHAAQLRKISLMDENTANRWCYADLKVRGWIV